MEIVTHKALNGNVACVDIDGMRCFMQYAVSGRIPSAISSNDLFNGSEMTLIMESIVGAIMAWQQRSDSMASDDREGCHLIGQVSYSYY